MTAPRRPRYLVLTTGLMGADGISAVARLCVRALRGSAPEPDAALEVLSLNDRPGAVSGDRRGDRIRVSEAGASKVRFLAAALRAAVHGSPAHVLCLHLRLGAVARLARRRGRLTIFLHGVEAWRAVSRIERAALHRADLVMANSEHTARRFREANPDLSGAPVRVCHLAVPDEDGGREASEPPAGCSPAPFALIVGRMAAEERYKGHDLLIDLWPSVLAEAPEARLVVAGDGDDRARLEARAAPLADRVRFLGSVPDERLGALYRDCAFFVMPSRGEGFGLVFLEAMRAGKPCIGGTGAAAEVIDEGVTGLVVHPDDPAQVLGAIRRLFREPETRERMGGAGAARVGRQFSEAHFRSRFRALLGLPPSAA